MSLCGLDCWISEDSSLLRLQGLCVPIFVDVLRVHAVQSTHSEGSDAVAVFVWDFTVRSYEGFAYASGRAKPDSCAGAM